jgi:hypothetical protein
MQSLHASFYEHNIKSRQTSKLQGVSREHNKTALCGLAYTFSLVLYNMRPCLVCVVRCTFGYLRQRPMELVNAFGPCLLDLLYLYIILCCRLTVVMGVGGFDLLQSVVIKWVIGNF